MGRIKVTARPTGRPVIPEAIELDENSVLIRSDGMVQQAHNVVLPKWVTDRMSEGYVCINCYEDLDTAYPDECPVCHYEMRDKQSERFAKSYMGNTWVGPENTLEDERLIMQEMRQRKAREQEVSHSRILVPGKDF